MEKEIILQTTYEQYRIGEHLWLEIKLANEVSESRERRNVIYRHAFSVAMRTLSKLTVQRIGKILGKDHATVIHAVRAHEGNYNYDPDYRSIYERIHKRVSEALLDAGYVDNYIPITDKAKDLRGRLVSLAKDNRKKKHQILELSTSIEEMNIRIEQLNKALKQKDKLISSLKLKIGSVVY